MKIDLSTGCLVTVPQQELDRRIAAVRALMEKMGADLFMAVCPVKNGYGRWLTGTDGPGRPSEGAVLVGKTGDVVTVNGAGLVPRGEKGERNYAMSPGCAGEGFSGYASCEGFSADLMEAMMGDAKGRENPVIAMANTRFLRAELLDYLKENFPKARIQDVTFETEHLRAVKSEKEQEILRQNARMLDKLFAGAGIFLNPQKYERDVVTELRYAAYRLGAGGVDHLISVPVELTSARDGERAENALVFPGRKLEYGDRVNVKMFAVGNDGYYAGMARSFVLGRPYAHTSDLWKTAVEAQNLAARLLRPGAFAEDAAEEVNAYLQEKGLRRDRKTMIHGVGACVQEPPCVFEKRRMPLEEGMVLYVGPVVDDGRSEPLSCGDLYLVKQEGAVRLTAFPRELMELYV